MRRLVGERRVNVFICYTWDNQSHKEWVKRFATDLRKRGIDAKLDEFEVGYGKKIKEFITREIHSSDFFLFISTNESRKVANGDIEQYKNRYVWLELEVARSIAEKKSSFMQICILREGDNVPHCFSDTKYVDLRDNKKYHSELEKVIIYIKHGINPSAFESSIPTFTVKNFSVNYIIPEYTFLGKNALSPQELQCKYENVNTQFPANLKEVKERHIETKREEAIRAGNTFDNNLSYSLYAVSVERDQDISGFRQNRFILHLRPTDYFSFVFPNLALDETINIDGNEKTARDIFELAHQSIRIENLANYLCDFRVGCGTIFITSDNKVVISIRSNLQFVVGGLKYHLSSAEGMLRPADEKDW
jgi:hypothetical protein